MQKRASKTDFHVKINPEIRDKFKQECYIKGFSTCFMIETLIQGWLAGATHTSKAHKSSTITINQKIEYMVEKPRRRMVGVLKKHLENVYFNGMWTYRRPERGEILSKLGHVPECQCNACMPEKHAIRIVGGRNLGSRYLKE